MDTAAFEVSHSVGTDKDATALRAARARSGSIGALDDSSRNIQCEHTPPASLAYPLVSVSVALPLMSSPPPLCQT